MNRSWEEGILPQNWKMANVKFLKKAHKLSYNNPSAYRPISLTSVVSKLKERIVLYRIEEYVETNNIIDNEQEGFRQYRSTVNALLSLIQSIYGGFNKKMITLALFIDFEKAYDTDIFQTVLAQKCKFADDATIWHTGEDINILQQDLQTDIDKKGTEYWTTLGSSKTRTSEQAIEGQRLIKQQLEELPPNTTVAFTDGSCMGNPGPCGAGAIIYNNEEEETIQYPVSNRGSILLAELVAIKLVLEKIDNYNYRNVKQLNIYSDSQSAVGIITLNWKSENYHKTIQEIKNRKIKLEQKEGNEQADRLAKAAAKEADNREEMSSITTKQDIKQAARTSVIKKWKTQWESSEVGRRFFNHHPDASKKIKLDFPSKKHFNILNSLRSGYSKLKGYQHFINRHVEDNKCTCGEIESVEHFLLSCDNYSLDREKLRQSIYFKT
ncbi:unnamed protein product [Mytilus edulis]|uniref:RNase H type-1 domain-containing protein n=1 Tax=Mytilus edulis TaxID=6550 RepID=A0A8S3RJZ6_MYTED|nr:unnamed protein product [Mytilus edulis]